MSSVTMKHIYKKYAGGVIAVTDFNLDIEDKEFIILVGPSGCGKSTTLRMIAGLEEISEGELYIDGKLCNDVPPKERDIAMVFQNYALYPHMTVYENMSFGLKLRKTPKDEIRRRVEEAAQILEIEHLLDRKPAALSGGQRQRVALGRAIVRNPKVFLLDEPLSNLDAKLRAQMRSELTKLHKKLDTTFIYVTHDQTEAMTMGSRIVVMKDGVQQQVSTPQDLYQNPNNRFVATFIGSPAMNMLDDSKLTEKDGKLYITFGDEQDNATIEVPESIASKPAVRSYIGKEVVMGIRPEHVHDEAIYLNNYPQYKCTVTVDTVEPLGSETNLFLIIGGKQFTARVDPTSTAKMGDKIEITMEAERMHLFDPETEKCIDL
ncbi:MAG: sn-glycerol-3-phosphate ABC transporter ATP-binding protein UgpC [Oscillospiraceae bacterium]|nr:sn-glycerol-3-phosphate ABC transporter ATP-binding protein UgpC [Oscillospiraceae bacterium]